jgi:LPS export ABC transporter permease LptF/LPS export ABC transporter permease LptG
MFWKLIQRYILAALLPYTLLSLVILTAILLTQQANKFAEIMGTARAPLLLAVEVMLAILPNVLVFTLPMAMLVGTSTGFSRMGSDSELIAMRSAGIGTWRIIAPVLVLGAILSALTLWVGFELAPSAAQDLRDAATRAALYKLESPVDPRSFYTDMPGKVVFVRDGDQESGQWGRVFIYWQEAEGQARLVTARSGRIDITEERSELVLSDALITTLPSGGVEAIAKGAQVTTERSEHLRVRDDRLNVGRSALLKKIREREPELDEMEWARLLQQSQAGENEQVRRNATILLHKKMSLSFAPLIFAFFGSGVGLRIRRGGRALGVVISLAIMLAYYLVSIAGEQAGRAGIVDPVLGAWLPFIISAVVSALAVGMGGRTARRQWRFFSMRTGNTQGREVSHRPAAQRRNFLGLLDTNIFGSLGFNFAVAFLSMLSIFLIFTLFELLRFIAANGTSWALVFRYLIFLIPLISVTVAPLATLLAALITYALLIRRNEAIAWWASGQSVYRLVIPGLLFGLIVGGGLWVTQEHLMPAANRRQNSLRTQIRNGFTRTETTLGRQWLATPDTRRLYSYGFEEGAGQLNSPVIYEFDEKGIHLSRIVLGQSAYWEQSSSLNIVNPQIVELKDGRVKVLQTPEGRTRIDSEPADFFKRELKQPSEMNLRQLSAYLNTLKRKQETSLAQVLAVSLERKRADIFAPFIMVLVGAPLAVSFGRRSTVIALCIAVMTGIAFWGVTSGFQQMGFNGLLQPKIAVWSPPFMFSAIGLYLLTRVRS